MFAADGSISTIVNSYSARAAFGWKTIDLFYLGPRRRPSLATATARSASACT
jgi:hypothetical protein